MVVGEEVVEEGFVEGGGVVVRGSGVKFGGGGRDREGSV